MSLPNFLTALSVKKITVSELLNGDCYPVLFVDVRSSEHHTNDQIGPSTWIPLEEITDGDGADRLQGLVHAYRQSHQAEPTVILYCTICPGALQAYRHLQSPDIKLAVLSGGLTAWRQVVPIAQEAEILANIFSPTRKIATPHYPASSELVFQSTLG